MKHRTLAFTMPATQSMDICGPKQSRLYRQFEGEHRPVSNLAGHADGAAMGFDDRFGDGQSHSGSMDLVALSRAAIELVKDETLLQHSDSHSAIGYADDKRVFRFF